MGLPNVMQTGRTGMFAAKAAIGTTGHNISNANTEGFSRQRVHQTAADNVQWGNKGSRIGQGVSTSRAERINDGYLERQVRNANKETLHFEEKELVLTQVEDVFNEMHGDGLNRLVANFFNEFRKLGNDPASEAVRQSVSESAHSMVNDFHRIRSEVQDIRRHIDSKIEGTVKDINESAQEVRDLNEKIRIGDLTDTSTADLQDKRDLALKKLSSLLDISAHPDQNGTMIVELRQGGTLISGPLVEKIHAERAPAGDDGKQEGSLDIYSSAVTGNPITHSIKGGKLGGLLEVRDQLITRVLDRLDEMAFSISNEVNDIHEQGFTLGGKTGVAFFSKPAQKERAAEFLSLSSEVHESSNNIAAAMTTNAPGDNRIALAIAKLQSDPFMNEGRTTVDDWYNSIVGDVGTATAKNRAALGQSKTIQTQLEKMREQISGVSIDEETANLLQFQHAFDASAKVIQVADEMFKTILEIKRY